MYTLFSFLESSIILEINNKGKLQDSYISLNVSIFISRRLFLLLWDNTSVLQHLEPVTNRIKEFCFFFSVGG